VAAILQAGLAQIEGLVCQGVNTALTVFGLAFWFDILYLIGHFIESRAHPTPGGRGRGVESFFDRLKGMLIGYASVYLAITVIAAALNAIAGGSAITASSILSTFFIKPVINGWAYITTGHLPAGVCQA